MNDGFVDAIKHYDDKNPALDKAVDDLQKDVSMYVKGRVFEQFSLG